MLKNSLFFKFFWSDFKKSAQESRAERKAVSPVVIAKNITDKMASSPPHSPKKAFETCETTAPALPEVPKTLFKPAVPL